MAERPPSYARERAAFWRVDLRTMQRWLARVLPPPVADVPAMLAWFAAHPSATQAKFSPAFRRRIAELRVERERALARSAAQPASAPAPAPPAHLPTAFGDSAPTHGATPHPTPPLSEHAEDPYYAEFIRAHPDDASAPTDADRLAGLRQALSFANFKLLRSQARGDHAARKDATEEIRHLSGVIRQDELAAQKLNREIGDTLPRADAARLIRALPYWLLRGIDSLHAALDRPLAAAASSGPLLPETIRTLLEPRALAALLHAPLVRAAQVTAPNALPRWALDEFRAAHAATLEDGAKLWDELYATPVPKRP